MGYRSIITFPTGCLVSKERLRTISTAMGRTRMLGATRHGAKYYGTATTVSEPDRQLPVKWDLGRVRGGYVHVHLDVVLISDDEINVDVRRHADSSLVDGALLGDSGTFEFTLTDLDTDENLYLEITSKDNLDGTYASNVLVYELGGIYTSTPVDNATTKKMWESSGIADASYTPAAPNQVWAHRDPGDEPDFNAQVDEIARHSLQYMMPPNVEETSQETSKPTTPFMECRFDSWGGSRLQIQCDLKTSAQTARIDFDISSGPGSNQTDFITFTEGATTYQSHFSLGTLVTGTSLTPSDRTGEVLIVRAFLWVSGGAGSETATIKNLMFYQGTRPSSANYGAGVAGP